MVGEEGGLSGWEWVWPQPEVGEEEERSGELRVVLWVEFQWPSRQQQQNQRC